MSANAHRDIADSKRCARDVGGLRKLVIENPETRLDSLVRRGRRFSRRRSLGTVFEHKESAQSQAKHYHLPVEPLIEDGLSLDRIGEQLTSGVAGRKGWW